ncbi:hypothetical protein OOZ19_28750 [Saccharopolyspora sp. NFXS83]|uniref:hypothetical protein n=1 Tax=Saccharopolyspora sp. NFXS83 TaxID=2993560 RepID=UPI00224ADCF8|nr:hypothetical protein [Saccharopolyspora sp. NFXS83]MCX2734251.1 hypothetical protein [Saccharopolyspora sp. NFXS83]
MSGTRSASAPRLFPWIDESSGEPVRPDGDVPLGPPGASVPDGLVLSGPEPPRSGPVCWPLPDGGALVLPVDAGPEPPGRPACADCWMLDCAPETLLLASMFPWRCEGLPLGASPPSLPP